MRFCYKQKYKRYQNFFMMDSSYPFEDNQLIEELARNLNLTTSEYSALPEAEKTIDRQAIENVFDLLLKRIVLQQEIYIFTPKLTNRQRVTNIFEKIAPTIWMKLSVIGAVFFILAAIILGLLNPTATTPIRIYIYLFGFFGLLFTILWEVRWLSQLSMQQRIQNAQEIARLDFEVTKEQATGFDFKLVDEAIETANYSKKVIQYVENKIRSELELQSQKASLAGKTVKVAASFIILSFVYNLTPVQILLNTALASNIVILNSIVTVLAVLGAGVILFAEWVENTFLQWKIMSYKICLNLLKQAQMVLE